MTGIELMNIIIDQDLLDAEVVVFNHDTRKMGSVIDLKPGSTNYNKKAFLEYTEYRVKKEYPNIVDNRHKRQTDHPLK